MRSKLLQKQSDDRDEDRWRQQRQERMEIVNEEDRLPNLHTILPPHQLRNPLLRNPPAEVTIYRAVPVGIEEIRPGDWVALDRSYATSHGRGHVIKKLVPAQDVVWAGTDMNEFFYVPYTGI